MNSKDMHNYNYKGYLPMNVYAEIALHSIEKENKKVKGQSK